MAQSEDKTVTEEEFRDRIEVMGLPYLRFSVTPDCNAACSFCHNEGQKIGARGDEAVRTPSTLSIEQVEYIADFFEDQFDRIKFTGGEPTLISNLAELIDVFASRGYECSMTSNGFLLDEQRQRELSEAGLSRVNISLPTIDPEMYQEYFGVSGNLDAIFSNLDHLPDHFDDTKLNFMAFPDSNVPSQLVPMTRLSGEKGIPVSFLRPVSDQNFEDPLSKQCMGHIEETVGLDRIEEKPDDFFVKKFYHFSNGGVWEVDDFRRQSYRDDAFDNEYCQSCDVRDQCVEGPYALRITHQGDLKTCLIRSDNMVSLSDSGYEFAN